jgi:hypothetical protein
MSSKAWLSWRTLVRDTTGDKWKNVGNEINAACIVARADFVNVL